MRIEAFVAQQTELARIVYELSQAATGEEYAPNYFDYPEALAGLLKASARLELALKQFQKNQADNLSARLNLAALNFITFDQLDDLGIFVDITWEQDEQDLSGIFTEQLPEALAAGALMSQQELGFTIDFNPADQPAQRFLDRHIPKLAGEITDTTKTRVTALIKRAIATGQDREHLEQDLGEVFDDPKRRRMIAQTESVQAFAEGRIQAGIQMGADQKQWVAQVVRCPICDALDGEIAPIDDYFDEEHYAPPGHPNCKCGLKLVFSGATSTADDIAQRQRTYNESLKQRFP